MANSEDLDEMSQDLHCLLRQNWLFEKKIHVFVNDNLIIYIFAQYTVRCQIKVHKVNFKAKNNGYFQHL